MKNILIIILSILFIGMTGNVNAQTKTTDAFTVKVDGLGCPFCAYGLEKKFNTFGGVKNLEIEMSTGTVTFEYNTDKALKMETVAEQIDEAGYTAVRVDVIRGDGKKESLEAEEEEEEENKR